MDCDNFSSEKYKGFTYSYVRSNYTTTPLSKNHVYIVCVDFFYLPFIDNNYYIIFINNNFSDNIDTVEYMTPILQTVIIDNIPTKIVRFVPVQKNVLSQKQVGVFSIQNINEWIDNKYVNVGNNFTLSTTSSFVIVNHNLVQVNV
jgi:hypothetical protein